MRCNCLIFISCLLWALAITGCGDQPQGGGPVNTNSVIATNTATNSTTNTRITTNTSNSASNGNTNKGNTNASGNEDPLKHLSNIAFNKPEKMRVTETTHIQLLLSPRESTGELRGRIEEEGAVETRAGVRTSDRVEAVLTGSAFKITELTPKEQDISLNMSEPVEWKWEIKALETGPQRLDLTLNSVVQRDGVATRRSIRSFDATIVIDVLPWQDRLSAFIGENWQWLWTTLLVPIATALFVSLRRRRAKAA